MSIADAMATNGMKELGYEYINMDGELPYVKNFVRVLLWNMQYAEKIHA